MIYIGLDIGSTTVSAVALDAKTHAALGHATQPHHATLEAKQPWEHIQNPERLVEVGCALIDGLRQRYGAVAGIGLTGQMHGILYVGKDGKAVSPLYTWQDRRAGIPDADGLTLVEEICQQTQTMIREGYGLATHLWNVRHHCVPQNAQWLTTICGYMAMRLVNAAEPTALHTSDAASLGFFDLKARKPNVQMLQKVGIDPAMMPCVTDDASIVGRTPWGAAVYCGIGDNQASFCGSVSDMEHGVLLNIGTGSQITRKLTSYAAGDVCEIRPFVANDYIAVGSALCGGRAFALLEQFIRSCAVMAGMAPENVYAQMSAALKKGIHTDLRFDTLFCGTRQDPKQRASITNLSAENFTAADFVRGVLRGIVEELYGYFQEISSMSDTPITRVYCSGNLVRLVPEILQIVEEVFSLPALVASTREEAAYGAALHAIGNECFSE